MKKIIITFLFILICFLGVYFLVTFNNDDNNPYQKKDIHAETRKQLKDSFYQNIILPKQLDEEITTSKNITVYFYSPTCEHCKKVTPIVTPITQKIGVELKQFNLLEYEEGWEKYHIVGTPTIIHFSNGKEKDRIMGMNSKNEFKQWFEKIKDK
ncbi:thioredoxin family protein [Bacillus thuringiensis]|uniref:Thiol reductase thioredoxin n=1 Tax=Bacillus thuringiensis subsp. higo TaxID=132266 RepID=A0A9X6QWG8_BACUH|nr:thioredoxin family protein [Bacillus thuringiensis]OUB60996.1 thiol reductase thioredoxin [Bacillus thuringiensis serovar higo]